MKRRALNLAAWTCMAAAVAACGGGGAGDPPANPDPGPIQGPAPTPAPPGPGPAPGPDPGPVEVEVWTKVADEGQNFTVQGSRKTRFGIDVRFVEQVVSGTVPCTRQFYGRDPAPNVVKICEVSSILPIQTPPPDPGPDPTPPPPPPPPAPPAPAPGPQPAPGDAPVSALGAQSVELPLRRLSSTQYLNALRDVVRQAMPSLSNQQANGIRTSIEAIFSSENYPQDAIINVEAGALHGGYTRTDQRIAQPHIDAMFAVGTRVGALLTSSNTNKAALAGNCATDNNTGNDATCIGNLVRSFGRLAFRRPLSNAEADFYVAAASAGGRSPVSNEAVAEVVSLMLNAPQFFYLVENGQASVSTTSGTRVPLTAHEMAARLSFHFWGTVPDAALNTLADNGQLLVPATYRAKVAEMAADSRTTAAVKEFFAQWIRLGEVDPLNSRVGTQPFDAFRNGATLTPESTRNAIEEINDMVGFLYANGGTLQQVLTDTRAFARTPDIAALYGDPVWDGRSAPQPMRDATRAGLLTRVALLSSGLPDTRPVIKGLRIRNGLLCEKIGAPPPEAQMTVVPPSTAETTREVLTALTNSPSCVGCHLVTLNPLGFMTENFDSIGRARTAQQFFQPDGRPAGSKAVDTAVTIRIGTLAQDVADARGATQAILQSGAFEKCFSQEFFRFQYGRLDAAPDGGAVTDLAATARAGRPLTELMARAALRLEFQTRDFR